MNLANVFWKVRWLWKTIWTPITQQAASSRTLSIIPRKVKETSPKISCTHLWSSVRNSLRSKSPRLSLKAQFMMLWGRKERKQPSDLDATKQSGSRGSNEKHAASQSSTRRTPTSGRQSTITAKVWRCDRFQRRRPRVTRLKRKTTTRTCRTTWTRSGARPNQCLAMNWHALLKQPISTSTA